MVSPTTPAGRARQEYIEYILKADPTGWPLSVHESNLDAIEREAAAAERERIIASCESIRPVPNDRMGSGERTDYFEGWLDAVAVIRDSLAATDEGGGA